ncbi:MAG: pirin family protein [Candidatus Kapaibacterium sp.]
MEKIIHRAEERGHADHGWLNTYYSFSFASYQNPEKMNFGLLRVINDDIIAAGGGFDTHPHKNMEIITIPLQGALEHKDNTGGGGVIRAGDIQVMSAGSGILHSEFNPSEDEPVNLLQIWIFPKNQNISPRYDQRRFDPDEFTGKFRTVVSPLPGKGHLWINQDAYISLAKTKEESELVYQINKVGNGVYLFLIEGEMSTANEELNKRDAIGLYDVNNINLGLSEGAHVLAIEVPME